ncbi:hypothetical protein [Coralliovum pocilloporae]|uniref:hypothetical protein n=1 Tax=Coralliovum pocilloporae TaxID=3066369 RepID=UPI00330762C9
MKTVLGLYEEQIEALCPIIRDQPDGFRAAAHTLKGASLGVGCLALADFLAPHCSDDAVHSDLNQARFSFLIKETLDAVRSFRAKL